MDKNMKIVIDEKARKGASRNFEVTLDNEKYNVEFIEKKKIIPQKKKVKKIQPVMHHDASNIVAPIPGTVKEYKKEVGDKVKAGETVLILEAMKMYNSIDAMIDGEIKEITCQPGDSVSKNQILAVIE